MNITAELSLYPLTDDYVPIIRSYIEVLNKVDGLEVNIMSTEIFGKFPVMETIQKVTEMVLRKSQRRLSRQVFKPRPARLITIMGFLVDSELSQYNPEIIAVLASLICFSSSA